ncbi:hypothetical protein GCM10008955_30700 [Deinococcus malanensis]|uniref:GAF domain-containing protein n=1 Tax=Deinococcus malanensis TaxID=1706855 RepID=A0ABQ2EZ24_9DEIO|nr:hypothetical protein GCM10008955_30700 [Deinococcus malanensis]
MPKLGTTPRLKLRPLQAEENRRAGLSPPAHEDARPAELHRFGILDTLPAPQFDRIVALAARYLDMPMAAVTFVDQDRQWFKARLGLTVTETLKSESICAIAIQQDRVLVIPDARKDPRVNGMNCFSVDQAVGFYAGAPLRTASS